jgi:hypothetical protein
MKTPRALLLMAALAIVFLAFSLANAGTASAWLADGPIYRYPAEGGTWKYGFWNAQARSYYVVGRTHGSTVYLNSSRERSVCTRSGYWSYADLPTVQRPGADDRYFYRIC